MKNYFKALTAIVAMALIVAGCTFTTYPQGEYAYNYDYGDGPMYTNYNQPTVYYSNNQAYQYQRPGVTVNLSFNDFYAQLSPHGIWVEMAPYGQVWIAGVPNFQPYSTNGYWAYTTYGWTWVSNYSWGWAPFHYGRWGHSNRYGWYWVPGYVWGPAWVAWSTGADMYGWAPLMPGMNYHVNLSVRHFPSSYWTFMPGRYMGYTNIGGYYVNRSRNTTIINNVTIINNYGTENNGRYSRGPSANDVQRYTGRSIQPMRISNVTDTRSTGVSNNEMRVYRPTSSDNVSSRTSSDQAGSSRSNVSQSRTQSDQPATNRTATQQQTRTQTDQPTTNRSATPQTRSQSEQPATNRSATQQTRTQTDPATNRSATPQTRTQSDQPANDRSTSAQTREQLMNTRAAMQQSTTTPEYRPNPAQPRVTNSAAPQTTRQIEAAQKDNTRTQQRSTETNSGRR